MILEPKRICSDTSVIFYHYFFFFALIVCFCCFTTADCFSWRYLVFPGGTVPVYSGQQLWPGGIFRPKDGRGSSSFGALVIFPVDLSPYVLHSVSFLAIQNIFLSCFSFKRLCLYILIDLFFLCRCNALFVGRAAEGNIIIIVIIIIVIIKMIMIIIIVKMIIKK